MPDVSRLGILLHLTGRVLFLSRPASAGCCCCCCSSKVLATGDDGRGCNILLDLLSLSSSSILFDVMPLLFVRGISSSLSSLLVLCFASLPLSPVLPFATSTSAPVESLSSVLNEEGKEEVAGEGDGDEQSSTCFDSMMCSNF